MLTLLGTRMLRLLWLDMVAKVQFGSNTAGLTMWQFSLPGGRYATLDSKDAWIWHIQKGYWRVPPPYTLRRPTQRRARIGEAVLTAPFTTVTWARLPAINARPVPLRRRQCSWVPRCVRTPAGLGLHPFYRGWCLYVAVLTRAARGVADPACHGTFEPCTFSGRFPWGAP